MVALLEMFLLLLSSRFSSIVRDVHCSDPSLVCALLRSCTRVCTTPILCSCIHCSDPVLVWALLRSCTRVCTAPILYSCVHCSDPVFWVCTLLSPADSIYSFYHFNRPHFKCILCSIVTMYHFVDFNDSSLYKT